MDSRTRKIIFISLFVFILILVGLSIFLLTPKADIKFITAPDKVVVQIDNNDKHSIKNGDKINVSPGSHTVIIFEDGFNPYEKKIVVKNGSTYELTAYLTPLTDSAISKLNNVSSDQVGEKVDATNQLDYDAIIDSKYPVFGVLPIDSRFYHIYQCQSNKYPNDPTMAAICIEVDLPSADSGWDYKTEIIADLKSSTFYNVDEYEIIWNVTLPDGTIVE